MIISHRYQFIFIKTHKTAGSSMEMALAPFCGPDDIITPMEANRGSAVPRNYHEATLLGKSYASSKWVRKCLNRHSPLLGGWYYEHMPAVRVRELVGREIWDGYHKFCFERNPWAKVVSYYNWKKHGQGRRMPSFRDYVLKSPHRLPTDGRLYFDGDQCLMEEVLDFEGFQQQFAGLCARLGIPFEGVMPREKTGIARDKPYYQDYYDQEIHDAIARLFPREIGAMGYEFDPSGKRSLLSVPAVQPPQRSVHSLGRRIGLPSGI